MRLTLRTLLAYMDEILEPADQEELSAKVETSEFAADLIHRTRDTVRRLRLSAPQAVGTGLGLDPNTVAEYLDNTLPPESVADLERICLESDIHLAEVASCHHVLTMVLGEPASIDPAMRTKMYSIPEKLAEGRSLRPEPAHSSVEVARALPTHDASERPLPVNPLLDSTTTLEVPDYLRASRRSVLGTIGKLAAIAALLAAVVYVGALVVGPSPQRRQAAVPSDAADTPPLRSPAENALMPQEGVSGQADATVHEDPADIEIPPQPIIPAADGQVLDAATTASETSLLDAASTDPSLQDELKPPTQRERPALPDSLSGLGPLSGDVGAEDEGVSPTVSDQEALTSIVGDRYSPTQVPEIAPPRVAVGINGDAEATPIIRDGVLEELKADAPDRRELTGADATETAGEAIVDVAAQPVPSGPIELGTYWADRSVLLQYDAEQGEWRPLAKGSPLSTGDRLLTLPTFRPTLALNSGIGVTLTGATSVTLSVAEGDLPQLQIVFGRVVLLNSEDAEVPLMVLIGDAKGEVRLASKARIAFDVQREWVAGSDPEASLADVMASAFVPNGGATWLQAGETLTADEAGRWEIIPGQQAKFEAGTPPPDWIDDEPADRLDLLGAEPIRSRLQPNMSAATVLLEMSQDRRREVRSLATQCSIYVGQFIPFIGALRDRDQRNTWDEHIETLRAAMALGPQSAASVRQTLVDQHGAAAAADLYEMLCGYDLDDIGRDPESIQSGALDRLINQLENDRLDYRVLAAHNLNQITGKSLLLNPAAGAAERARGVRTWRQRLREGELKPLDSYGTFPPR